MPPEGMHGTWLHGRGESCSVLGVHIGYMAGSAGDASYEVCAWLLGGICDAVSKNRSPLLSSMLGP